MIIGEGKQNFRGAYYHKVLAFIDIESIKLYTNFFMEFFKCVLLRIKAHIYALKPTIISITAYYKRKKKKITIESIEG